MLTRQRALLRSYALVSATTAGAFVSHVSGEAVGDMTMHELL